LQLYNRWRISILWMNPGVLSAEAENLLLQDLLSGAASGCHNELSDMLKQLTVKILKLLCFFLN